jgi:FkbM family methyltransferase
MERPRCQSQRGRIVFMNLEEFKCPLSCLPGVGEVFAGQYQFAGLKTSGPPPVILDIGANVGAFSAWALLMQWPNATLHAYEPNPVMFDYLQQNCSPRVKCHNAAVGNAAKNTFYFGRHTPLCGSLYKGAEQGEESTTVSVIAPEELPRADIIKIDAEGSEAYIVEHLRELPSLLVLEWHSAEQRVRVESALRGRMKLVATELLGEHFGLLKYIKE